MRRYCVRALVSLMLTGAMTAPALAAGAWVGETVAPTLRQHGWRYATLTLAPRPSTPVAGRAITRISWAYGYTPWQPRLAVAVCGGGRCADASRERGISRAFAGLPVATDFQFYFLVAGHGPIVPPLGGRPLTLVVNFK